jgi:SAM-dependent methyltransferase
MDTRRYNKDMWDRQVALGNKWTVPFDSERVEAAKRGDWSVVLTPVREVPAEWFGDIKGKRILGLACGGGQQGPLFAAAGADVTILDNSPKQLARDRDVAERDGLVIHTVEGDMADMPQIEDESFDLIFHPCSNSFVPEILPVWQEAFRVLRPGGELLSGFANPVTLIFDDFLEQGGELVVRHRIPYSDLTDLEEEELEALRRVDEPLVWGHTLEDQLAGQLHAGFVFVDLYEDTWPDHEVSQYINTFMATRARKPA